MLFLGKPSTIVVIELVDIIVNGISFLLADISLLGDHIFSHIFTDTSTRL